MMDINTVHQSYDFIVIGAGAAGLAAARHLGANSKTVVVLEAQNYIGGRIHTFHDWGKPIELGAEFVHGTNTITAQIISELGLKTINAHQDRKLIDESGKMLHQADKAIYYRLMEYVAKNGKFGLSVSEIIKNNSVTSDQTICRLVELTIGDYEAGDADALDSGAYMEMEKYSQHNGDNILLRDGYQQIIGYLERGLDVRLNSVVARIDYSEPGSVSVITESGDVYLAPKVIVTVSLGVLKARTIFFTPKLPQEKNEAIGKIGMGNAVKLLLRFKDPHQVSSLFNYADGDNESLQTVTCWWASGSDPRVLVGYCGGRRADNALALPEKRLLEKVSIDLSLVFGHDLSDQIVDYKIVRWDDNPYIKGAYSNHPVGVRNRDRTNLASPVSDCIFLAGEATIADGNYATVHGAITSGFRAAEEAL